MSPVHKTSHNSLFGGNGMQNPIDLLARASHNLSVYQSGSRNSQNLFFAFYSQEGLLESSSRLRPILPTRTGALFGYDYYTNSGDPQADRNAQGQALRPIDLSGLSAKPKTDTKNNLKVLTEELSSIESRIEPLNSNSIDSYQLIYTNAKIVTIQNAKDDWLKQNRIASRENAIETLEIEKTRIINELTEERNRKLANLESRREEIKKQIDELENSNSKTENQSIKDDPSELDEPNQKASNSYYEERPEESSNLPTDTQNSELIANPAISLSGETTDGLT